jgi:hypothetical protein
MARSSIEELLTEILVIKDLYICGRMNQSICFAVVGAGQEKGFTKGNWQEYEELSESYIKDSIAELFYRQEELIEKLEEFGSISANIVFDTCYLDFDDELINDMMTDFYGGKDSVAFASSYNYFSEDFNAIFAEFVINELN